MDLDAGESTQSDHAFDVLLARIRGT